METNEELKKDLEYIKKDLISLQPGTNKLASDEDEKYRYIKFSRILNSTAIVGMTKKQYINFWRTQYIKKPELFGIILNAINEKFKNGLISIEEMREMIINSKDTEKEKKRILKEIRWK